jgi:glycine betaine/choline ABC-type transport system substrate-binding protein
MVLKFKDEVEMDIGLKYDAIKNKKVDVINAFFNGWSVA